MERVLQGERSLPSIFTPGQVISLGLDIDSAKKKTQHFHKSILTQKGFSKGLQYDFAAGQVFANPASVLSC